MTPITLPEHLSMRFALVLLACWLIPPLSVASRAQASVLDATQLKRAGVLYDDNCSICHEPGGKADTEELNLADDVWNHGDTLEEIIRTIRDGVPDTLMKP